ncbi:hypothetical protein TNCV_955851 [Trichonephila clavipes]|nr:hypothetical protein TNCV_955851 [Trichonephila clavipes]
MWKEPCHENCLKLKERQENPFCINCQDYGHSALHLPQIPQPKKEPLSETPRKSEISPLNGFFANVVSGEVPNQIPIDDKKKIPPRIP